MDPSYGVMCVIACVRIFIKSHITAISMRTLPIGDQCVLLLTNLHVTARPGPILLYAKRYNSMIAAITAAFQMRKRGHFLSTL